MPLGRDFYVEIYRTPGLLGRQKWQWRAISDGPKGGNYERLARGERYVNKQDLLKTIWLLFGDDVMIKPQGSLLATRKAALK